MNDAHSYQTLLTATKKLWIRPSSDLPSPSIMGTLVRNYFEVEHHSVRKSRQFPSFPDLVSVAEWNITWTKVPIASGAISPLRALQLRSSGSYMVQHCSRASYVPQRSHSIIFIPSVFDVSDFCFLGSFFRFLPQIVCLFNHM